MIPTLAILLATEAGPKLSKTAIFFRGVIAVIIGLVVFVGSVWLVVGTNIGARKGLFVVLAAFAGFVVILSLLWFRYPQQAPKPEGPVCLGGRVNPDFLANGGAPDQAKVDVEVKQDGKVVQVSIPACTSGMVVTKYFYPTIFMTGALLVMLVSLGIIRRIEISEGLAE
ncbi:MAG: hypothetical protein C4318_00300 [Acidimicrobiia bacterium]|mgnify:CR=1 FL=1